MPYRISRQAYAETYGPTTGDRIRLADTELILEVEKDFTTYGDEVKFGGGKVIRDGMGQSQTSRADGAVDTVITNALILDWWGIVKADIGLDDAPPIKNEGIGNHGVNGAVSPGGLGLAHPVANHLSAAKFHFIAVGGEVLLHFKDEFGVR